MNNNNNNNTTTNNYDTGVHINTSIIYPNNTVEISYAGLLTQNGAEEIYVHFGSSYLEDWANINDIKMIKNPNGAFSADIVIPVGNKLNICFKDSSQNWDNNNGNNYVYDIKK